MVTTAKAPLKKIASKPAVRVPARRRKAAAPRATAIDSDAAAASMAEPLGEGAARNTLAVNPLTSVGETARVMADFLAVTPRGTAAT